MANQVEIRLPRGRLIFGHPMKLRDTTDPVTRQKKLNDQGQPKQECFIQVAIPKTDPALYGETGVFAQMSQAAGRAWPANPAQDPFAWKVDDGDAPRLDRKTNQYVQRAEYCLDQWLFNIKSHGWVPSCVYQPAPGQPHQDMLDPGMIKTGDYIDVIVKVEPNGAMGNQAGVYVNPALVRFNEAGGAISTGSAMGASDADKAFADSPAAAPAPAVPGYPPAAAPAPAAVPGYPPAAAPAPAAVPAPNYDPNFAAGPQPVNAAGYPVAPSVG